LDSYRHGWIVGKLGLLRCVVGNLPALGIEAAVSRFGNIVPGAFTRAGQVARFFNDYTV
jgi:hypothetical protein